MAYIYSLADTWNASGTTFTGIGLNVTDTASAAGSLLMDLQVGGSSKFRVTKSGILQNSTSNGVDLTISYNTILRSDNGPVAAATGYGFGIAPASAFAWNSGGFGSNGFDLALYRDAANTLAQRNSTAAQELRVYKTYSTVSDYERVGVGDIPSITGNNGLYFGRAGTGQARGLYIFNESNAGIVFGTNGSSRWQFAADGVFLPWVDNAYDIGAVATRPRNVFIAGYNQLSEMTAPAAPAANGVRIYAEDNGSGKTRLMAVFATGAAVQLAIEP